MEDAKSFDANFFTSKNSAVVAQLVEHVIGNDEVSSSILLNGSHVKSFKK